MKDFFKSFVSTLKFFAEMLIYFFAIIIGFGVIYAIIGGMLWWFNELFGAVVSVLLTLAVCVVLTALGVAIYESVAKKKE